MKDVQRETKIEQMRLSGTPQEKTSFLNWNENNLRSWPAKAIVLEDVSKESNQQEDEPAAEAHTAGAIVAIRLECNKQLLLCCVSGSVYLQIDVDAIDKVNVSTYVSLNQELH